MTRHRIFPPALTAAAVIGTLLFAAAAAIATYPNEHVRPSALAGTWYPGDRASLEKTVDNLLQDAKAPDLYGELRALILPHAGYAYSGLAAAVGINSIGSQKVERVIVLAPTHRAYIKGCSVGNYTAFRTPLGDVPVDTQACARLCGNPLIGDDPSPHSQEHSIEIQLPLLQRKIGEFKLVPMLVGEISYEEACKVAASIEPLLDAGTLLIVSSDFTHYGPRFDYQPFKDNVQRNLQELDYGAFTRILEADAKGLLDYRDKTGITACGILPIAILIEALGAETDAMMLSYYTSGEKTGDWSNSVSYGSFCFTVKRLEANAAEQKTLLKLARDVLATYTADRSEPPISFAAYNITPALLRPAGVFVTLTKSGELRGCIGTIVGVSPIYRAVVDNTKKAAAEDPRFPPVTSAEAAKLAIEISILTPLEKVESIEQIRVGVDGLLLRRGNYQGLLLPQVATEYNLDRDRFLQQLCLKAGLRPGDHLSPDAQIFRFQVQKFREQ